MSHDESSAASTDRAERRFRALAEGAFDLVSEIDAEGRVLYESPNHAAVLGRLPGTNIFRNVDNFPEAETVPSLLVLRIDASLYFANTEFLKHKIRDVLRQGEGGLKAIILDASSVNDLDSSATTALHQIARNLQERRIEFFMAGVKGPVREVMIRSGLYNLLGGDHFFFTIDAAVKRYQSSRAGIREN